MKQNTRLLYAFMLMNFINGMGATLFGGILDKVATSLNISIALTGLLATAYALGAAIGVPIVLIVFSKTDRKPLMVTMLILAVLSTFGVIYAPNFALLLVFRTLMGVTGNSYGVLAISTVISMSTKERQGRSLAFLIMGNSLALIIGVPLTRALSAILDWRAIFWILNSLTILLTFYFGFKLPHAKKADGHGQSLKEELQYLKSPWILAILGYTLLMFVGYAAFFTYSTPYLVERFPALEPIMSLILVAIGLATFAGNHVGGQLSDRIGYGRSMLMGAVLQFTSIVLLILFQGVMWANVLFAVAFMMSAWLTGLQLNVGIMQESHHEASFILSLNGTGIQLGSAIGSSIGALVISQMGLPYIVGVTLITTLAMILLQGIVLKIR